MSTRLTNEIRNRIINAVMDHRFTEETKAVRAMEHALALDIWNDIHDPLLRRQLSKLPGGYLTMHDTVRAIIGVEHVELKLGGCQPGRKDKHGWWKQYPATSVFASLYQDFTNRKAKLQEDKDKARSSLKAAVYRYSTDRQLIEAWPEIASFVKKMIPARAALPALQIETLNQALRLPPKKAA